tara:strand:+ start:4525 stop:4809 length:285 start_codon:yes stop_codon:yes gene_type:complete
MNNNDRFDKVDTKLDKLDERLDGVEKILAVNTQILKEHERRSTTLEDRFINELKPLKSHVALIQYGFRAVMWVAVAIGGVIGTLEAIHQMGLFK